jgi:phage-related protein
MPRVILPEFLKVIMSIQTAQLTEKLQLAMVHFTAILRRPQKQDRDATKSVRDLKANLKAEANMEITKALQRVSEIDARACLSNIDDACMSHQRLQALDGLGYRACYMDKLRQVARK